MAKHLTTKELYWELIMVGHNVEAIDPGNGTFRITRIDDKVFSHASSEGNKQARKMLGAELSRGAVKAIKRSSVVRARKRRKKESLERRLLGKDLTKAEKKELRKLNKKARKMGMKGISTKRARKIKKALGGGRKGWEGFKKGYKRRYRDGYGGMPSESTEGMRRYILTLSNGVYDIDNILHGTPLTEDGFIELRSIWYDYYLPHKINLETAIGLSNNILQADVEEYTRWKAANDLKDEDLED